MDLFKNRQHAGQELAKILIQFKTENPVILASPAWEGAETKMTLPAGRKASFEDFCHKTAQNLHTKRLYFLFDADARSGILGTRYYGHRAVGVVYQPQIETRGTSYVKTIPAKRYDAFVFVDKTSALISIPTKISPLEFPETWPGGL